MNIHACTSAHTHTHTHARTHTHTRSNSDTNSNRQTGTQTGRQKQMNGQTDRQADTQTDGKLTFSLPEERHVAAGLAGLVGIPHDNTWSKSSAMLGCHSNRSHSCTASPTPLYGICFSCLLLPQLSTWLSDRGIEGIESIARFFTPDLTLRYLFPRKVQT